MARRLISSLSPETKMTFFYVVDGFYFAGFAIAAWQIIPLFNQLFIQVIFGVLMLLCFLFTVYRPKGNPMKRNIDVLWLFVFKRDMNTYYTVHKSEERYFEEDLNDALESEHVIDMTTHN